MFQFFKVVRISKLGSSSKKKRKQITKFLDLTTFDIFKVGLRTILFN